MVRNSGQFAGRAAWLLGVPVPGAGQGAGQLLLPVQLLFRCFEPLLLPAQLNFCIELVVHDLQLSQDLFVFILQLLARAARVSILPFQNDFQPGFHVHGVALGQLRAGCSRLDYVDDV